MQKLTFKEKIGYGSAGIGDSVSYNLVGLFLMFFLTNVAGVEPVTAGTITAVGAVWNAAFNPVMGYFSDGVRTRFGRRRPVIFCFAIPLALTSVLLYTTVDFPYILKAVYYGIMIMLFWTCYTGFFVPYLALGVDYTGDYEDRTILRLFTSMFNMFGALISMALPTVLVQALVTAGLSTETAWTVMAGILGVISTVSIMITVAVSGTKDPPCPRENGEKREKKKITAIFAEYLSVARLKPMKHLVVASVAGLIDYSMMMSNLVYYLTYVHGADAGGVSGFMALRAIVGMALIPIVGRLALKFDRRQTLIGFNLLGTALMVLLRITGTTGTFTIVLYLFSVAISTCVYWHLMPSIYYDVCDYDRLQTGNRREGAIVSFQGLIEAVAAGCGNLLLGVILQMAGFDGSAAVQSEKAMFWIENAGTVIPVIFLIISSIAVYRYPITKTVHAEIRRQLAERDRDGQ